MKNMTHQPPQIIYKGRSIGIVILTAAQLSIGAIHIFFGLLLFAFEVSLFQATLAYDVYTVFFGLLTLVFAVFSHCYNPWIKFRGGRGLATSLGGTLLIAPFIPAIWLSVWVLIYLIKRDILLGNITATICAILLTLIFPEQVSKFAFPKADSISTLMFFTTTILIIISIKHIDPLMELLTKYNIINKEG